MAFEASTRFDQSKYSASREDSLLRSPDLASQYRNFSSSYLKSKDDKLTESALQASTRNQPASSQKRLNHSIDAPNIRNELAKGDAQRSSRPNLAAPGPKHSAKEHTPRKLHFFSEYMKDFDPAYKEFRSPPGRDTRKEQQQYTGRKDDEVTRSRTFAYQDKRLGERSVDRKDITSFKIQPATTTSVSTQQFNLNNTLPDRHDPYHSPSRTPDRAGEGSYKSNYEGKVKSGRKDEIRAKLSKLSEKLYSPIKTGQADSSRNDHTTESTQGDAKEVKLLSRREYSNPYLTKSYLKSEPTSEPPAKPVDRPKTEPTGDYVPPPEVTSAANYKSHLESIEKRHEENLRKLRDELRETKEALLKERTENTSRNNSELRALNDKVRDLDRLLGQETEKNRVANQKIEENKAYYEKRIAEMRDAHNKQREEFEKKILELGNSNKNQGKTHRDALNQIKAESDALVGRLKEEQSALINDLQAQLEKKNLEIERMKRDRTDTVSTYSHKSSNLNEMVKNLQEINDQLKHTIEQKNEEINRLGRRVNDARKDYTGVRSEYENVEREKSKLSEENDKLRTKVNRLDNYIASSPNYRSSPRKGSSPSKGSPYKSHYY